MAQVAKTLGIEHDESQELPVIPWECEYVWHWYWDIRSRVGGNGFGPNPISHTEIQAWRANTRTELFRWELSALQAMDNEYMRFYAERQERRKPNRSAKSANTRRLHR